MEGLPPYPAYKDSGLPWLGRVPAHWGGKRGKALFNKVTRPVHAEDGVITCFRDGVVTLRKNRRLRGFTEAIFELGYQGIRKGDLVIHAMDAFAGAIGVSDSDGKGTPVYAVCQPQSEANSYYYAHIVREMARTQWIQALSRGIRERSTDFRYETFGRQELPVPPSEEQAAIVRFLDHATRRIDNAIRAKRKIIALLNEQKQAIIHRAVTRGLDPDVPLKDSGVPWLGQIPAHWTISRLKFETSAIVDCLHATPKYESDEGYPAIRTADIEPGKVRLRQARQVSRTTYLRWTSRLEPREGDILYSREGERFGIAAPVPEDVQLCISQRMMVFRVKPAQSSDYIMWQLNCPHIYAQASVYVIGSTAPHVNIEQIKNYYLALPPVNEQMQIVHFIAENCSGLDDTNNRITREIDLLREYRTRLIADVVTGKLDVRAAAARLPKLEADEAHETIEIEDDEEALEEAA